jgi:transcriptional regulator with XRE-family HTH domain
MNPRKLAEALGTQLRQAREARGLRLQDVVKRSSLQSVGYLSRIERGLQLPPLETLFQIKQGLGLTLKEFLEIVNVALSVSLDLQFRSNTIQSLEKTPTLFVALGRRLPNKHIEMLNQELLPKLQRIGFEPSQPLLISNADDPRLSHNVSEAGLVIDATGLASSAIWESERHHLTAAGLLALRLNIPYTLFYRQNPSDQPAREYAEFEITGWITRYYYATAHPQLEDLLKSFEAELRSRQSDIQREYLRRKSLEALKELALSHNLTYSLYLGLRKLVENSESFPIILNQWKRELQARTSPKEKEPLRP